MKHERYLKVKNETGEEAYTYYIRKVYSKEFERDMYNVGISTRKRTSEIEDFSPSYEEAVRLMNYLYDEHVTVENLFLLSEEFIVSG